MKHLLIVTPIFPPRTGGPATYTWHLINQLKTNYQISVICFGSNSKKIPGVSIATINPLQPSFARQFLLLLNIIRYGVSASSFYVQGPLVVGFVASLAAKFLNKRLIIKYVGDEVWEASRLHRRTTLSLEEFYSSRHNLKTQLIIILQQVSLRLAHNVIVPSQFLKTILVNNLNINPTQIVVIYNAVELSLPALTKKPHQLIYVGRLVPWKNIHQIITAVHQARAKLPWTLLVVGEGPELHRLQKLAAILKANSWIKFTGRQSSTQTIRHLVTSQKLILYSDYEGLSHTLIEAMLSGTAIIASDITANRQVTHGYAQLVPLGNPDQLSTAINSRSSSVIKAKNFAQKQYSWDNHLFKLQKYL